MPKNTVLILCETVEKVYGDPVASYIFLKSSSDTPPSPSRNHRAYHDLQKTIWVQGELRTCMHFGKHTASLLESRILFFFLYQLECLGLQCVFKDRIHTRVGKSLLSYIEKNNYHNDTLLEQAALLIKLLTCKSHLCCQLDDLWSKCWTSLELKKHLKQMQE